MEEKKWGGARPGAGQPKKEVSGNITFRVPERLREEFKIRVRELLKELKERK